VILVNYAIALREEENLSQWVLLAFGGLNAMVGSFASVTRLRASDRRKQPTKNAGIYREGNRTEIVHQTTIAYGTTIVALQVPDIVSVTKVTDCAFPNIRRWIGDAGHIPKLLIKLQWRTLAGTMLVLTRARNMDWRRNMDFDQRSCWFDRRSTSDDDECGGSAHFELR
jgi:hypothetical protein